MKAGFGDDLPLIGGGAFLGRTVFKHYAHGFLVGRGEPDCGPGAFEKSPDAKPGLGVDGVAQRTQLLKQHAPWDGSSDLPLDRSPPAVGLACARREEGKGNFADSASFQALTSSFT
jgi:hypothetical protein